MREIRFRAWHPVNKVMVYFDPLVLVNDMFQCGHLMQLMKDKSELLQQFTGLKDKNGKEIYEGDVVTRLKLNYIKDGAFDRDKCMEYIDFGVVEYMDYNCQFMLARRQNPGLTNHCNNSIDIRPSTDSLEYEIIGNIYENKELLKQEVTP